MGSVIDYIKCPHCGNEAINDYYYKSGEEYTNCSHCGYHYSITIKNRDKNYNELTDDDIEIVKLDNPYGACKIKIKDGVGWTVIPLEDEEHFNQLRIEVEKSNENEVEGFCLSRFIDGKIKTEYFMGTEDDFK